MNEIQSILSKPEFWAIIIPALIAVLIFQRTKEAEREAEWRKEKLKLYLSFIESLSGITDSEITDEGEIRFAKACNDLHALASIAVLAALHKYQDEIRISNPSPSAESKQAALEDLVFEIRCDLRIKPSEKRSDFNLLLWTSGKKKSDADKLERELEIEMKGAHNKRVERTD